MGMSVDFIGLVSRGCCVFLFSGIGSSYPLLATLECSKYTFVPLCAIEKCVIFITPQSLAKDSAAKGILNA
jgi:hypothetical protein